MKKDTMSFSWCIAASKIGKRIILFRNIILKKKQIDFSSQLFIAVSFFNRRNPRSAAALAKLVNTIEFDESKMQNFLFFFISGKKKEFKSYISF